MQELGCVTNFFAGTIKDETLAPPSEWESLAKHIQIVGLVQTVSVMVAAQCVLGVNLHVWYNCLLQDMTLSETSTSMD
jgi:hypothetical protein